MFGQKKGLSTMKEHWVVVVLCIAFLTCCQTVQARTEHTYTLDQVDDMDVSSKLRLVATAEHSGRVLIWNWETGQVAHEFPAEKDVIAAPVCVRFIESMNAVFLLYNSGASRLWDLATGRVLKRSVFHDVDYVSGGDAVPLEQGGMSLLLRYSGKHSVYRLTPEPLMLRSFDADDYGQDRSALTPDGQLALLVSDKRPDLLRDIKTGDSVSTSQFPFQVQELAFSADARLIATGTFIGLVDVWDTHSGKKLQALQSTPTLPRRPIDLGDRVHDLSFSESGELLAALSGNGHITTWNLRTGRQAQRWQLDGGVWCLAYAGANDYLIAATKGAPHILTPGKAATRLPLIERTGSDAKQSSQKNPDDLLMESVIAQEPGKVDEALSNGADPNLEDSVGATPLWVASGKGGVGIVKSLLKAGAKVDAKSLGGSTALWMAAQQGHLQIVKTLLSAGANVDAQDKFGGTPLQWAANNGHESIVAVLIEKGADVNLKRKSGATALKMARDSGHEKVVEMLQKAGAKD
jgi:WD40 repeat protein